MATVPSEMTAVAGAILTATQWNTNVRDPINFLITSVPMCSLIQTVSQSIPNNALTPLTWDSELADNDGMHSNTVNNTRMTAQTAGWYLIGGGSGIGGASATGFKLIRWHLNGNVVAGGGINLQSNAASFCDVPARTMITFLNAGDYLELAVDQTTGGAVLTSVGNEGASTAWARWLQTA